MATNETNQMLAAAVSACEDKKAEDIRILALDPSESGLTDYFLICNGTNDRQNVAIADEIELRLKREFKTYPNSVEGRRQAEWILLDYVDFIVHVFSAEKRAYYGLERLRKSATTLSVSELNAEIKQQITAGRRKTTMAKSVKKTEEPTGSAAAAKKATGKKSLGKASAAKSTKKSANKAANKKTSSAAGVRVSKTAKPKRAVQKTAQKTAAHKSPKR